MTSKLWRTRIGTHVTEAVVSEAANTQCRAADRRITSEAEFLHHRCSFSFSALRLPPGRPEDGGTSSLYQCTLKIPCYYWWFSVAPF